ncbi:MAG: response regulator transcription factor [Bacteroidota bacterium]
MTTSNAREKPIEIVLVEDDSNLRDLLKLLLNGTAGFFCRADFGNAEAMLKALPGLYPDLLLMDIDLGDGINGIEAVSQVRVQKPELNIVMLTVHEDEESVFAALCAGAVGYLVKGLEPVRLLEAVQTAVAGGAPMSPVIARRVVKTFHGRAQNPLSEREQEVLRLLCQGESYRGISEQLFVSGNTVRSHIKSIYQKLHVHSRAEVVAKAIKDRLV